MHSTLRRAAVLGLMATTALGYAQTPAPVAAAASAASAPSPATRTGKTVIEDGQVRIEETRLRGQPQAVTVQSKLPGVKAYEIILPPLGKDPSQDKGAAGMRTWSLFGF